MSMLKKRKKKEDQVKTRYGGERRVEEDWFATRKFGEYDFWSLGFKN